ncbi:MAG: SDR family oxidoreductase, partial [Polyangiaceae bacterium]
VTGGAGFIGSHIVDALVSHGHAVRVLDNFSAGKRDNLSASADKIEIVEADVRDAPQLDFYVAGCDVIFHEAAIVSVPYSIEHPQETHDVNVQGTLNVLQSARRHGVKRVVFASSAAVYGQEPTLPKKESMQLEPVSPYGVEKAASEHYLFAWQKTFGVETVALRYFNVFGPRQDPSSPYSGVISIFMTRAIEGKNAVIYGDGEQSRDFVFAGDVAMANLRAAETAGISGNVYNVGAGKRTTLNELASLVGKVTGKTFSPEHEAARSGDIVHSLADVSRAKKDLAWAPEVGVEEGLKRLFDSIRSSP